MSNANDWYGQKTIKEFGAFFVVPQRQETWTEFAGSTDGKTWHYTQLQLLDYVTKKLRSRSSQVVPLTIKGHRKRFALICSTHERRFDQGIKRGFAFVALNQDGSLTGLSNISAKMISRHVKIVQKEVNGYPVWRGMLDDKIMLG